MALTHEDQRRASQIGAHDPIHQGGYPNGVAPPNFNAQRHPTSLLRRYRQRSGMSMTVLAAHAGYDHSFVSRIEAGVRQPSREAVLALAEAMDLDELRRDRLLASFGFMPLDPARLVDGMLHAEPAVAALYRVLSDPEMDGERKTMIRGVVSALVGQGDAE